MGLLSTAYNMDKDAVKKLIFNDKDELIDGALEKLLDLDKSRVKKFNEDKTKFGDEKYSHAKREVLEEFEKTVKGKFNVTSEKKGLELIEELIAAKTKVGPEGLTEEAVKKSKWYLDLETAKKTELEAKEAEFKTQLEAKDKEEKAKTLKDTIRKEAEKYLDEKAPILDKDDKVAKKRREIFIKELLELNEYEEHELTGGKTRIVPVDKTSKKRLEDEHGNAIGLDKIIEQVASEHFVFDPAGKRSSAGDPNDKTKGGAGAGKPKYNYTKAATPQEYSDKLSEIETTEKDPKVRGEKMKEYMEAQEATGDK